MSKRFVNQQPQRTQISTVTNAPFIQNSNRMALSVDRNRKFSERIFQLLHAIFKANVKQAFRMTGLSALLAKTIWLSSIFLKIFP